jgi:hypothetical protein
MLTEVLFTDINTPPPSTIEERLFLPEFLIHLPLPVTNMNSGRSVINRLKSRLQNDQGRTDMYFFWAKTRPEYENDP